MARFTTERGLDRLVNFSDATVAIAVTLLVLPLADIASGAHGVPVSTLLHDNSSAIYAFLLSFLVIAVQWLEHHGLFEAFISYNTPVVLCNLLWLLAIIALPFSTEANHEAPSDDRAAAALYIGNLLLAFAALAAIRAAAWFDRSLLEPKRRDQFEMRSGFVLVALCALALIIAVVFPAVGEWSLLLLALTGLVSRTVRLARRSR